MANIYARMKQIRDLKANWDTIDPILLNGEIGVETDTGKLKLGNGVNKWSEIAYLASQTVAQDFAATTTYLKDEVVVHSGLLYRALADFTSGASFNAGDWEAVSSATVDPLATLTLNALSDSDTWLDIQSSGNTSLDVQRAAWGVQLNQLAASLRILNAAGNVLFASENTSDGVSIGSAALVAELANQYFPQLHGTPVVKGTSTNNSNTAIGFQDWNGGQTTVTREIRWNATTQKFEFQDSSGTYQVMGAELASNPADWVLLQDWGTGNSGGGYTLPSDSRVGHEFLVQTTDDGSIQWATVWWPTNQNLGSSIQGTRYGGGGDHSVWIDPVANTINCTHSFKKIYKRAIGISPV